MHFAPSRFVLPGVGCDAVAKTLPYNWEITDRVHLGLSWNIFVKLRTVIQPARDTIGLRDEIPYADRHL